MSTPYLDLGLVSAYADAKRGGYTGTYDEFCALLAGIGGLQPKLTAGQNISINGTTIDTRAFPCSPNLLDNWYFPHPVNQRGQTAYTGAGYCIDRWKLTNASAQLTVDSGGVTLGATDGNVWMQSYLEDGDQLPGKTVTVSLLAGGALYAVTGTLPVEAVTSNTGFMTSGDVNVGLYKTAEGRVFAQIGNKSGADAPLTAVKLELGSEQTLAHQDADGAWVLNEIPDYAEQERRCMRFLYVQNGNMTTYGMLTGSKKNLNLAVPVPVPMRSTPALVGVPGITGVRTIQGTNMAAEITGGSVQASTSLGTTIAVSLVTETFNTDEYVNNTPIVCYISGVVLSAEL